MKLNKIVIITALLIPIIVLSQEREAPVLQPGQIAVLCSEEGVPLRFRIGKGSPEDVIIDNKTAFEYCLSKLPGNRKVEPAPPRKPSLGT